LTNENEKKLAINLQKELEREKDFLKQNTEAIKNFEVQREYLSRENEYLNIENKELESLRGNQQETIISVLKTHYFQ